MRYGSDHAYGLLELVRANREELIQNFAQLANLQNLERAEALTRASAEQWQLARDFCYGIFRKDTSQQIGQVRVKNISWEVPSAELSFFIERCSQRHGYAAESISTVLSFAFQQLLFERMFVRILPSNQRSLALVKKLGFQEEGLQRKAFRCGFGHLHDVCFLSIVRKGCSWAGRPQTTETSPNQPATSIVVVTDSSLS
jgi:RimJ/RimL family protein N-acetyltransferase